MTLLENNIKEDIDIILLGGWPFSLVWLKGIENVAYHSPQGMGQKILFCMYGRWFDLLCIYIFYDYSIAYM